MLMPANDPCCVTVVGAGGNIGSYAVGHLARTAGVGRLTLVDSGFYEEENLATQDITVADVGRNKAVVQGRKVRRIRPQATPMVFGTTVERLPLGVLRAGVIVCCVDSVRARQSVNDAAWRLGVPWVDAGVQGDALLARVNVYVPAADGPCFECAFDQRDYDNVEQTYPCGAGDPSEPPSTNAPSSLGALAASLQAIETQKLLAGRAEQALVGRQVVVDAAHHRHYVTRFRRNPACRRSDHAVWEIEAIERPPEDITFADLLQSSEGGHTTLRVDGHVFVRRLRCPRCGWVRRLLHLESSLSRRQRRCRRCGGSGSDGPASHMLPVGDDVLEQLDSASLSRGILELPLARLGLRLGEVLTLTGAAVGPDVHYEITGDRQAKNRLRGGGVFSCRQARG